MLENSVMKSENHVKKIYSEQMIKNNNFKEKYIGKGICLYINGKRYIDCASGTFNLSLGYSAKEIVDALKDQLDSCSHLSSEFTKERSQEIFNMLEKHLPQHINSFWFRDIIGSTANECALKIAMKATGKTDILSLFLSHHGQTIATTEISGNAFRKKNYFASGINSIKLPAPNRDNCFYMQSAENSSRISAEKIEDFIKYASAGNIAALIIEPILGNGGNVVPNPEYYKIVRKICDKHGIILIADEVQTGFGRTGSFFASNGIAKDLKPDIITFAKGAGGIGIPVAGVLMRKELDVLESWEHSTTSGANPLALTALAETIKYIEKYDILANVNNQSTFLKKGLEQLENKYTFVSAVRGKGLMFAFDLPNNHDTVNFIKFARQYGLIMRSSRYGFGRAVKVRPPLIVTKPEINEIIEKLDVSLNEFGKENYKHESFKI